MQNFGQTWLALTTRQIPGHSSRSLRQGWLLAGCLVHLQTSSHLSILSVTTLRRARTPLCWPGTPVLMITSLRCAVQPGPNSSLAFTASVCKLAKFDCRMLVRVSQIRISPHPTGMQAECLKQPTQHHNKLRRILNSFAQTIAETIQAASKLNVQRSVCTPLKMQRGRLQ